MTRLAQLIAKQEGFGIPGAIPTIRHNPGDLRHSPHSAHPGGDQNAIGTIDTDEHGWEDLDFELLLIAHRHPDLTLGEFVGGQRLPNGTVKCGGYPGWAPAEDGNDPAAYTAALVDGLGMPSGTPFARVLQIQAEEA
jgi:hypothetical protein